MSLDLEAIKARLVAPYAAGAYDITVRLADGRLCATVRMRDWAGNTAHEADAAVTRLLGHAPADLTALVAEVEHLRVEVEAAITEAATMRAWAEEAAKAENEDAEDARKERAAVVAFLRGSDDDLVADYGDDIERGEHRRKEEG